MGDASIVNFFLNFWSHIGLEGYNLIGWAIFCIFIGHVYSAEKYHNRGFFWLRQLGWVEFMLTALHIGASMIDNEHRSTIIALTYLPRQCASGIYCLLACIEFWSKNKEKLTEEYIKRQYVISGGIMAALTIVSCFFAFSHTDLVTDSGRPQEWVSILFSGTALVAIALKQSETFVYGYYILASEACTTKAAWVMKGSSNTFDEAFFEAHFWVIGATTIMVFLAFRLYRLWNPILWRTSPWISKQK